MGESRLGNLKDRKVVYIPSKEKEEFVRKDIERGITRYEETRQPRAESLLCHLGLCASTPWALVSLSVKWNLMLIPQNLWI